jgi:hypothetical protein
MNPTKHSCHCPCCSFNRNVQPADLTRREFLYRVGAAAATTSFAFTALAAGAVQTASALNIRPPQGAKPLKVQPVLTYEIPQRREKTSWRSWGGIQTEADAVAEKARLEAELARLKAKSDFELDILPLAMVAKMDQAKAVTATDYDVVLVYAAGGGGNLLETLIRPGKSNLMFLRHEPGPAYLWYEIVHPRFLRKTVDEYAITGLDVNDVVVDDHGEVLWRLRALQGLKNTLGKKIVAIGGAGGWGEGGQTAPEISRNLWKLNLIDFPYKDLEPLIKAARQNQSLVRSCEAAATQYLKESKVSLHTKREFVYNAFVLREVMKDLMEQAGTDAITIQHCMGTIMGISETTACLPLSLLNDEGFLAFCESDFVVIPSGILLHYISGKPVFLNDPTYPHNGVVTLAHCTAPRKMDGKRAERTKILTHFESDYGAAPKVEMRLGQVCTNLVPDFSCKKWVGFEATIVGNPFLDICRSQIDVKVKGDSAALVEEMKGFHWMMSYGSYLRETGYALKKLGVDLHNVSAVKA